MEYNFREIEKKWQQRWKDTNAYKVENSSPKPKFYVLDMFPYPSGAGLHVGHPLGYIASDIYARFKRLKGFNVLHPMGYDAFGLPAEQYAIEKGVHPAISTEQNIQNFRKQLDNIGFCFDWDREVRTSDPSYYKWTQWIFLQLFKSFYNHKTKRAEGIGTLVASFEQDGNSVHPFPSTANYTLTQFTAEEWKGFDEAQQQEILMHYRLAYCGIGEVNWCEALGTVLANDEVVNGVSERGGYPVIKKKLRQWYLRITEYADRLLEGLERVEFSDAMKEMQGNWIGKSSGAEMEFDIIASPQTPLLAERGKTDESLQSGHYFKTSVNDYWGILKQYSRDNCKNLTEAEDVLWQQLRNNQLGTKARRQHAIQGYIVDFALLEVNLVVEIDGDYHDESEQLKYDNARTEYLKEFGFDVIRFTNAQVLAHTEKVIQEIQKKIEQSKSDTDAATKAPLSARRGVGGEATEAKPQPKLRVYTTRPDTIFGVDFMVIAPEHDLVEKITTDDQQAAVSDYITYVKSRSERERMAEKKITGCFTGAYAVNPFNGQQIPIWISEYVLAGYGTGAIMAVPCGDERDFKFAKHFNIPVTNIIGKHFNGQEANPTKDAILENSGFLNGMVMRQAIDVVCTKIEEMGIGKRKVNFRMRDAAFSRQRYWGEPFPIKWIDGIAYPLDESELPLELPHVDKYGPGPEGEGPLANIESWTAQHLETNTMPGYAGSSWYFLRYMDPHNNSEFCNRAVSDYWGQVDLYIGGTEHAVGHLLYSRMWTKALYDLGHIGHDEPYKKLVNQGMIQGVSQMSFVKKGDFMEGVSMSGSNTIFINGKIAAVPEAKLQLYSSELITDENREYFQPINIPIDVVQVDAANPKRNILDIKTGLQKYPNRLDAIFISSQGFNYDNRWFAQRGNDWVEDKFNENQQAFFVESAVEKMSKSKYNVVNPDEIIEKYGADTFRMYEMFLGPVEQSKPWDTKGIEGVHRFLRKLWRMFYDDVKGKVWTDAKATDAELKILHKAIKKIEDDTERFSFNTAVSAFMVCVNDLTDLKCNKKEVLEPLVIMLTPYAPHIAEELYQALNGTSQSVLDAAFPTFDAKYLVESSKEYPISINGKLRTTINMPLGLSKEEVQETVLANEVVAKWVEGKPLKNLIYVPNKMVNVVV